MTVAADGLTAFCLLLAVVCAALMASAYRKTGELLSPWTIFLGMAIVDIYVPAALYFSIGLDLPRWLSPLSRDTALPALLVFTAGAAFFGAGYARAGSMPAIEGSMLHPSSRRLALLASAAGVLFFLGLAWTVASAGGWNEYLNVRLTNRFAAPVEQAPLVGLLRSLGTAVVPVLFVLAGVAFHDRIAHPLIGIAVTVLAATAAATMLLRGAFLTLLMGLAIVERSRLHDLERLGSTRAAAESRLINRRIVLVCAVGLTLFVSYGAVRNYYTEAAYSGEATISRAVGIEMSRFVRGEGFVGLLGIVQAYPREVPFMRGRTIGDMLLLPVPRAIYTSKPLWYGIDDITRAMGWPESTMNAVTMPGELYANFSLWGIPLMWVYGWLFGLARVYRFDATFRYVYAFVFVPMMLPTFWMAFTGFVNQLVPIPLMLGALWFVCRRTTSVPVPQPAHA